MSALAAGTKAPDFELKTVDEETFSLHDELARGPVVLAFLKSPAPPASMLSLSWSDSTRRMERSGVTWSASRKTMPAKRWPSQGFRHHLPDSARPHRKVSGLNAYGLTNVPTLFWIAPDGEIEGSLSVGWVKATSEELNRRMAETGKATPGCGVLSRVKTCGTSALAEDRKTSHRSGGWQSRQPTAGPASNSWRLLRNPGAGFRSPLLRLPTPRFREPA